LEKIAGEEFAGADEYQIETPNTSLQNQLRDSQTQLLLETLKACGGVRKDMAAQLGISERTLRYKLKALRDRGLLN
jgi:two-component system response regulator FlrC